MLYITDHVSQRSYWNACIWEVVWMQIKCQTDGRRTDTLRGECSVQVSWNPIYLTDIVFLYFCGFFSQPTTVFTMDSLWITWELNQSPPNFISVNDGILKSLIAIPTWMPNSFRTGQCRKITVGRPRTLPGPGVTRPTSRIAGSTATLTTVVSRPVMDVVTLTLRTLNKIKLVTALLYNTLQYWI